MGYRSFCRSFIFGASSTGSNKKNLLKYRHKQLPQAYYNADKLGLKGALYPMVTFNGVECHNEWEITFEEIHRNGSIAYAIYNYTNYTGDTSYLKKTKDWKFLLLFRAFGPIEYITLKEIRLI